MFDSSYWTLTKLTVQAQQGNIIKRNSCHLYLKGLYILASFASLFVQSSTRNIDITYWNHFSRLRAVSLFLENLWGTTQYKCATVTGHEVWVVMPQAASSKSIRRRAKRETAMVPYNIFDVTLAGCINDIPALFRIWYSVSFGLHAACKGYWQMCVITS